jgi:hypothetical protein
MLSMTRGISDVWTTARYLTNSHTWANISHPMRDILSCC